MSDLVADAVGGCDLVDGALDVVADRRRRVEQHDAVGGGQERRLVGAVGDPVEVPLDAAHVVTLLLQRRPERRPRHRRVVRQGGCIGCGHTGTSAATAARALPRSTSRPFMPNWWRSPRGMSFAAKT